MSDYISRQSAIDTVLSMNKCCDVDEKEMLKDLILAGLCDLPAAPVREANRGKWLYGYCSCCGERTVWDETDYCPNCGADMRGNNS